ncbi:hypothetical protein Tco_0629577 [Tanacetum coccineum]|uniref:Transmembrane protein n=1 Tax=Tanacetum coccineum TaxID=301880 RepID=A0ABQ4WTK2_9ASTR
MTYPVASLTLNSARSYVMHGAPFTKVMISSIPIGGSISPEGFLPSILLMVTMVTVVIVVVILVVIVVVIFGVVVVVGGVSSIIKLSFMIIGLLRIIVFYYLLHQSLGYGNCFLQSLRLRSSNISFNTSGPCDLIGLFYSNSLGVCIPPGQGIIGVSLGPVFLLGLSVFVMVVACASRVAATLSATSSRMDTTEILEFKTSRDSYGDNKVSDPIRGLVFKGSSRTGSLPNGHVDLTGDEDPTDEDGDIGMGDSTGVLMSLGGEISSRGKKSWESNIGDSDNIGDGDTTVGRAI